jgi:glycosyltransferase involved in cell wall biosynthesis
VTTTYFIDNKLGGVTSLNYNLMTRASPAAQQRVISMDLIESGMTRANIQFPASDQIEFQYSKTENLYLVLKRLRDLVPDEDGALVLNYDTEMAMLDNYPVRQTTYQLVHDDYNVSLAKKYGHVVDVFICHNGAICKELKNQLPDRKEQIHFLPHGVNVPAIQRSTWDTNLPIKLLFLGRMAKSKGIFDIPAINDELRRRGIQFSWTCIGGGPDLAALKELWNPADAVVFASPATNEEVIRLAASCDIFVLPTRFEGSPVSLVETMSIGLVPVITDLAGSIQEIVTDDIGFRISPDNNVAFADAIAFLYRNPAILEANSANCRAKILAGYNLDQTALRYHEMFGNYAQYYRTKQLKKVKVGARLDQPYIPGFITKFARKIFNRK